MTLEQFLAALEKTPRKWKQVGFMLRCVNKSHYQCCPIVSVAGGDFVNSEYKKAANALGLGIRLANKIANAADAVGPYDPKLRKRLLKACGL
jgi:hypothetical protein